MKAIILIASFLGLFIIHAFKSTKEANSIASRSIYSRDIISCGETNARSISNFTWYDFTPGGDLVEKISINDNRNAAGELRDGVLYVNLEARKGNWYPETEEGKPLQVYAFAEVGKPMQLPGPLIRVPEGTIIKTTIRNLIPGDALVIHGMYSRPANGSDSLLIPFDSTVECKFTTGRAGTYFYWGTHGKIKLDFNGLPYFNDSQLYGAFIVDPPKTKPDPLERIIMIGIWNDTLNGPFQGEELVLNGLTWPYTERLMYKKDEPVNWRIINASNQEHPMHLHGFFFTLKSRGNADRDTTFQQKDQHLHVTEQLHPHETMSLTWNPNREGNWLFHCHTLVHMMAGSFLRNVPVMTEQEMNDISTHAQAGMGGLIMGITVLSKQEKTTAGLAKERQLTLIIKEKKNWYDTLTGYSFVLKEGNLSSDTNGSIPGPPIILEKGKRVSIKIINQLKENTTIHWHGLEIESYFDGVSGWGNRGKELAPMIMPGDSFAAHLDPPRAGTYIYHSHMHNLQLMQGMYGALIVTEPNEKYNNNTDRIFLISQGGHEVDNRLLFINGKVKSEPMELESGTNYRFRIINITALGPDLTASVSFKSVPVIWHSLAKDGANLQPGLQVNKPASLQPVTIGETMDFAFKPTEAGDYLFEVKDYKNDVVVSKQLKVH